MRTPGPRGRMSHDRWPAEAPLPYASAYIPFVILSESEGPNAKRASRAVAMLHFGSRFRHMRGSVQEQRFA